MGTPLDGGYGEVMKTGLVIAVAVALFGAALVPAASADVSAAARVDVVGSGTINWKRVGIRSAPSMSAPLVKVLPQFRPDFRPTHVLALATRFKRSGEPAWYRVSVPGRPNGRTGWVPAASVHVEPVDRWLVIYRDDRKFEFYVRGKKVRTGTVAVGAPGMETPLGLFYVQAKFDPTWPVLGAYAFETSGYSKLSDWPGGGVVGVHGTNTPQFLGQAVSHGCVRLSNDDIQFLRSTVPVGTPIKIVA
jgi:lipoprotein-anchoring transpeptidase ErfK/SrfK